jgi:hypothetical protein
VVGQVYADPQEDAVMNRATAFGLVLALTSLGYANAVTVNLTGKVTYSSGFPTIPIGSLVTGNYEYDDASLPFYSSSSLPSDGETVYHVIGVTLTFADTDPAFPGGSTITANPVDWPYLALTRGGIPSEDFYSVSTNFNNPAGPTVTGSLALPYGYWLSAVIQGAPGWGHLALDVTPGGYFAIPDPDSLLSQFPLIDCRVATIGHELRFAVDSLSVSPQPVPIPGAVGLGLVGLACARWWLRRGGA